MKLMKKVLSGLCALSLVMTAVASLAVNATESVPTLVPVITVDEAAGTADIVVKAKNLPETITSGGYTDPAYVFSVGCQVDVSSFATQTISGMSGRNFNTWKTDYFTDGYLAMGGLQSAANAGYLSYGGTFPSASAATSLGAVKSEIVLFTIHDLPLNETALKNGFTVDTIDFQIVLNNEYWGTGDACEVAFKENASTAASENTAWAPTPAATEEPTPTPTPVVTPEPTATAEPTATPVPTFDSGVSVFNEENDAAAWAWKTAPTEGSKVAVTLKVNGEEQVPKTFALKAAVEGTTQVGVIVQYNPTQFQTVEIVNIDFE